MAAINYWFPKAFGFRLNERWGKASFWCWLVGFYVAFVPLYILGLKGMTRRMNHYANPEWQPYLVVALVGAVIIAMGIFFTLLQFYVSVRDRNKLTDPSGDPWGGRTLEWSISSPAPFYNFALVPRIAELDQFWEDKQNGVAYVQPAKYEDIHMPRNTGIGVYMGAFGTVLGFALVWHIWWLAAVGLLGMIGSFIARAYDQDVDYWVPAAEVEKLERSRLAKLQQLDTTQVVPVAPSRQKVA
jgi:cytochrome o ubiquinol oxidase subunit 1